MIKRLLATVVLLLLPGLALPQPATAGADPWFTYPCESGSMRLDSITFEAATPDVVRVGVPGSMPCSAGSKYRFAVAAFAPGDTTALIYPGMLGSYNPVGPTEFVAVVAMTKQQQLGVCLMADPQTRLSCVLLSIDSTGEALASSLDTRRTTVVGQVSALRPTPECNACWSLR
jgi:hypothetical protein